MSDAQRRLVLVISILASFVAFLDGSVVNVALPAIMHDLGGGLALQQWVVDAYLISLGALMLVAGSLSDLFGRKRILILGLIGFGATSMLCAISPSGELLIVSRTLQGIAGALLVPSSLALIISAFSSVGEGKAIGTWTAWTGVAFVAGPLLGGFLVDSSTWRLIFAINVVPIVVTLWLIHFLRLPDQPRIETKVDTFGAALCALGLGATVYALIEQAHYGWGSPLIYTTLLLGLLLLAGFVWHESHTTSPMLPLGLFKVRNFAVGNISTIAIYAGLSVAAFLITVYVQQIGGYSAVRAGMSLLPVTIIMFLLSPRFGSLAVRYGPRLFMTMGPMIGSAGFLFLLRMGYPVYYWTELFPGVLLFGLGLSITVAPLTAAILGSIDSTHAGIGSAINNAISRIAGLIAIGALGLVVGPTLNVDGFHRGAIAMAVLLFLGGVISWAGIRNSTR